MRSSYTIKIGMFSSKVIKLIINSFLWQLCKYKRVTMSTNGVASIKYCDMLSIELYCNWLCLLQWTFISNRFCRMHVSRLCLSKQEDRKNTQFHWLILVRERSVLVYKMPRGRFIAPSVCRNWKMLLHSLSYFLR